MGSFGGMEWVVIILVVLLLFGAKKIPELARGVGQGINEFRRASNDIKKEIERSQEEDDEYHRQQQSQRYNQDQQNHQQSAEKKQTEEPKTNQADSRS